MRKIVISAVNFNEAGPLSILRDCLESAKKQLPGWEIIALVNNKKLISIENVTYYEFPLIKKSWIRRVKFEWHDLKEISNEIKADIWLSLHDISPRVFAKRKIVYFHNPAPFYKPNIKEAFFDPKFFLFTKFYIYLYKAFIKQNDFIIVQQQWLREALTDRFGNLPFLVAHPRISYREKIINKNNDAEDIIFFYPAFARTFKNHETLCEAVKILTNRGLNGFHVYLTIDGSENKYSKYIFKKYSHLHRISFKGKLSREQVYDTYIKANALIFPSKLETWGLPISEAKSFGLPIMAADLPYAHEAVGNYDKIAFFHPQSSCALANLMEEFIKSNLKFTKHTIEYPPQPFAKDWDSLIQRISAE